MKKDKRKAILTYLKKFGKDVAAGATFGILGRAAGKAAKKGAKAASVYGGGASEKIKTMSKNMHKKPYGGGASDDLKKLSIGLSTIKNKTKTRRRGMLEAMRAERGRSPLKPRRKSSMPSFHKLPSRPGDRRT